MSEQKARCETSFTDHTRRAKRRHLGIVHAKNNKQRKNLYRDLVKVTRKTVYAAEQMVTELDGVDILAQATAAELRHFIELGRKVIDQTERRVFQREKVPAPEKIVSIFEPHTDIIVKDRRDTLYGHKVNFTSGVSGMILDCVIEEGNPADSTRAVTMIERQNDIYGRPPRQACFDGGYASTDNLRDIKKLGVKDVSFAKRRGLKVTDMVKSNWVYKRLKCFRAGIEGIISFLKRCFGLDRCTWSGFESFKAYVWSSIVSANLLILARHRLAKG